MADLEPGVVSTGIWPPLILCPKCISAVVYETVTADLKPGLVCGACQHVWEQDYATEVARDIGRMLISAQPRAVCGVCDAEFTEKHDCGPGLRTKIDMLFEKLGQIEEKIDACTCKEPKNAE